MKKCLKYALLVGCALFMATTVEAASDATWSSADRAASYARSYHNRAANIQKVMDMLKKLGSGVPILDVTSVPAHAVVATEQEFIRLRTEFEDEVKKQIKERVSVKYKPIKTGPNTPAKRSKEKLDAKLSKVEINSKDANKSVEEGITGKGVKLANGKMESEYEGETSTYDLTIVQQANWVSGAGDIEGREKYENRRRYIEQEQAIRLLAAAAVLRNNVSQNLLGSGNSPIDKANAEYEISDSKKDLSGKGGMVEVTNDYNQSLRQYAYQGLVYDQLLSLEQQIVGLRLQTKAGKYAQGMDPLTDKLGVDGAKDPTTKDETKRDKETGTGTREKD